MHPEDGMNDINVARLIGSHENCCRVDISRISQLPRKSNATLRFIVQVRLLCYNSATMNGLDFTGLKPIVAEKLSPMVEDILKGHASNLHSFHVVGSAVIPDYDEKLSDINSLVVLHSMDLRFISFLAPL